MAFELQALFWSAVIMMGLIMVQGGISASTNGFRWGLGNRDEAREITPYMGRVARTIENHKVSMLVFVPMVVVIMSAGINSTQTAIGAMLYVVARAAFAVLYLLGVPVLRSVVWGVSVVGLFTMGFAILGHVV